MGSSVSNVVDMVGEARKEITRGVTSTTADALTADALTAGDAKRKKKLQEDSNFRLATSSMVDAGIGGLMQGGGGAVTAPFVTGAHDALIMDPRRAEAAMQNQADTMLAAARSAVGDSAAEAPTQADLTAIQRQRAMRGRRGTILTGGSTLGGSAQGKTLLGM